MALYHSANGSVNYTVVGNPIIADGIVSEFTASDYLTASQSFTTVNNTFSIQIKLRFSASPATQYILSGNGIYVYLADTRRIAMQAQISGGWVYASTNTALDYNTDYYVKWDYDGANLACSFSTDGVNYTAGSTNPGVLISSNVTPIFGSRSGFNSFGGSIDLNGTYISVNGQPWFGISPVEVKKHQIMGPVGYTKVGSPTITDGVASNFSNSSYIHIADYSGTPQSVEFYGKFTTGADVSSGSWIFSAGSALEGFYGLQILNGYCFAYLGTSDGFSWQSSEPYTISPNTTYYYSLTYTASGLAWKLGTSKDNLVDMPSRAAALLVPFQNANYGINLSRNAFMLGTIDLNETYIKINGKLWFYQPAPTKYIIREDKTTHAQKLVFADQGIYLTGPTNFVKGGSPTIVDSVASGFSSSNYFILPTLASSNYNAIEIGTKIKTGSEVTQAMIIGETNWYVQGILISGTEQLTIQCRCNYGAYVTAASGVVVQPNTEYTIKAILDKTNGVVSIQVNDATPVTNTFTFTTDRNLDYKVGGSSNIGYFNGSVDLKATYIKVDGVLWAYGKNYATKNIAPVPANYTYGTTTTSAIGYVDMRTQAFTAAPSGATLGRDE